MFHGFAIFSSIYEIQWYAVMIIVELLLRENREDDFQKIPFVVLSIFFFEVKMNPPYFRVLNWLFDSEKNKIFVDNFLFHTLHTHTHSHNCCTVHNGQEWRAQSRAKKNERCFTVEARAYELVYLFLWPGKRNIISSERVQQLFCTILKRLLSVR